MSISGRIASIADAGVLPHDRGGVAFALDVERDMVGARLRERLDVLFRVDQHQVDVEGQGGVFAHGGDDRGAERDVRDEMAVHYVQMDHVRLGLFRGFQFVSEAGEIACEDRRRNEQPVVFELT